MGNSGQGREERKLDGKARDSIDGGHKVGTEADRPAEARALAGVGRG